MAYTLTIGSLYVVTNGPLPVNEACSCEEARHGCTPSYVFSVSGQVGFRTALNHIAACSTQDCRGLRARVLDGMHEKLKWLMNEQTLLGCIHVQPTLYGAKRLTFARRDFPAVAHHLAHCPKESCAQLRRSVLLTIRNKLRPVLEERVE